MLFDVYRETSTLEFVAIINADSLEDAKQIAVARGYDLEYHRIEECED